MYNRYKRQIVKLNQRVLELILKVKIKKMNRWCVVLSSSYEKKVVNSTSA